MKREPTTEKRESGKPGESKKNFPNGQDNRPIVKQNRSDSALPRPDCAGCSLATPDSVAAIKVEKIVDEKTLPAVKALADQHRRELGFHSRESYLESSRNGELFAAIECGRVLGFVRFHHRRDSRTTLYEIAVDPGLRYQGIGRALVNALIDDCRRTGSRNIRLSCPVELPANRFYESFGFVLTRRSARRGISRRADHHRS